MSDTDRSDPVNALADRVRGLEESLGFADHAAQQMSGELLAVHKRIDVLARRIDAMERRLEQAAAIDEQGLAGGSPTNEQLKQNKPPHSA